MELTNLHIMNSEEYKKYILDNMTVESNVRASLEKRFDFTKDRLILNYGKESFVVTSEINETLPVKSIVTVQGLSFYVIAPNVVMVSNSIRDVKLYEQEEIEEFEGDDVFEFLNMKLEDLMINHVWSMNPEFDAEHVHPEEG